jgi:hypothetical protein
LVLSFFRLLFEKNQKNRLLFPFQSDMIGVALTMTVATEVMPMEQNLLY